MFRHCNSCRDRASLRFIKISVHRASTRLRQILRYTLSMPVTKMPRAPRRRVKITSTSVRMKWRIAERARKHEWCCYIMSRATGILHSAHARIIARDSLFCVFRMRLKRPRDIRMRIFYMRRTWSTRLRARALRRLSSWRWTLTANHVSSLTERERSGRVRWRKIAITNERKYEAVICFRRERDTDNSFRRRANY